MVNLSFRGRNTDQHRSVSTSSSNSKHKDPDSVYRPRKTTTTQPMSLRRVLISIRWNIVLTTLVLWLCVINFYERTTVRHAIQQCQWTRWESWHSGHPHRLALFADPQIMDDYSYPGRPAIVNWFARQLIDNYHKRNYEHVMSLLDPDTTVFLGDLFDGGRNWNDLDWFEEFRRFNEIYYKRPNRRTIMSLPGNHDIGFGETVNVTSLERFKAIFGPTSSIHDIGNHTLVLLDTISLSDYQNPNVTRDPLTVLNSLAPISTNEKPRILMSHVPLYRFPDKQTCGPLRESTKKFPIMKGEQYQTVIDYELSQEVLSKIRPKIVFSGDDHDYCHVTHPYKSQGVDQTADEITVKSCSMNMGVQYPAIQLLSLNTHDDETRETYETQMCYLPAPYAALKGYLFTLIVNISFFAFVFLLPRSYNAIVDRTLDKLGSITNKYDLPVAHQKVGLPQVFERDLVGMTTTSVITAISVLVVFSVYFGAF
ncbi:CYFA0S21e00408g1_1 [Cyberlindnera fabianii]|uniref:CYFA0S21e00408g1_1 n=1 Tax=Cyberlindnera fabianii TaxID=36022 RepID=A0A061B7V5_CYBFA|nr:CYFA0S21e00408g1_1 [Cyberlindnera fabianii]